MINDQQFMVHALGYLKEHLTKRYIENDLKQSLNKLDNQKRTVANYEGMTELKVLYSSGLEGVTEKYLDDSLTLVRINSTFYSPSGLEENENMLYQTDRRDMLQKGIGTEKFPIDDVYKFTNIDNTGFYQGIPIMEYDDELNTICVLMDLFNPNMIYRYGDETYVKQRYSKDVHVFFMGMSDLLSKIHSQKYTLLSFKEENELFIQKIFNRNFETKTRVEIQEYTDKARSAKNSLIRAREEMVEFSKTFHNHTTKVNALEESLNKNKKNIIEELNQIKDLPFVDEIVYNPIGQRLVIHTNYFDIYTSNKRKFRGSSFSIDINLSDFDIFIDAEDKYPGYWTDEDPHPHIGGDGDTCWGDIEPTLVELYSNYEFLPLITVIVEFLSTVNEDDIAGGYVYYRDELNEDGSIKNHGRETYDWQCPECGVGMNEEDEELLYTGIRYDEDNPENVYYLTDPESSMCQSCAEQLGYYVEGHGYLSNDVYNDWQGAVQEFEEMEICPDCELRYHPENMHVVYNELVYDGKHLVPIRERTVCDSCINEYEEVEIEKEDGITESVEVYSTEFLHDLIKQYEEGTLENTPIDEHNTEDHHEHPLDTLLKEIYDNDDLELKEEA